MRKRTATTVFCVLALALLLSACELRVEHLVVVEEDGSGTVECLALLDPQDDEDVEELLDGRFGDLPIVPDGWTQEAVDDGDFEGTRSTASFSDPAELESLLAALESANEEAGVGEPCLGLFTQGDEPLLAVDDVEARWSQQIEADPESDDELGEEISEEVTEAIDLEISVRLPGTLDSHDGDVTGDGTVTWRPTVGEAVDLHASSLLGEATDDDPDPDPEPETEPRFDDVPEDSAHRGAIEELSGERIITGFGDGSFRPFQDVSRAETASLLDRAFDMTPSETPAAFGDVPEDSAHTEAIERLASAAVIAGFGDGSFRPFQPVTRAEAASLLDRVLGDAAAAGEVVDGRFADVPASSAHAAAVDRMAAAGVITGFGDGSFRPFQPISRAEMASLLSRARNLPD